MVVLLEGLVVSCRRMLGVEDRAVIMARENAGLSQACIARQILGVVAKQRGLKGIGKFANDSLLLPLGKVTPVARNQSLVSIRERGSRHEERRSEIVCLKLCAVNRVGAHVLGGCGKGSIAALR